MHHITVDLLRESYFALKRSASPGLDGVRWAAYGQDLEARLPDLHGRVQSGRYRAQPSKRSWIPKSDGRQRPLGIASLEDKIVQQAVVRVLNEIYEQDFLGFSYGFRPGRSPHNALDAVWVGITRRKVNWVLDVDIRSFFDSIPHAELMKSVARRISDSQMLHLIKLWLTAPVEEIDERGRTHRTTRNQDEGRGVPQGAPISPLLSNLYMRRFVLGWKVLGHEKRLNAHVVNYADDFVICCRGTAEAAGRTMRNMMGRLKLTVNEEKTQIRRLPAESFEFLGYTIGRRYSPRTGRASYTSWPSKNRVQRICVEISEVTSRRWLLMDVREMVANLNRRLRGWANYFCLGSVSKAYRAVDAHARTRLRRWLCRKHKKRGRGTSHYPDQHLYGALGLVCLPVLTRSFPWAKGVSPCPKAGCGKSARPV